MLLRSISKIKRQINPRLKIDGILLTMVDNRTNNAKAIISSLRSSVGENIRVFNSEIPFSVRAAECSLSGESIMSKSTGKATTIELEWDGSKYVAELNDTNNVLSNKSTGRSHESGLYVRLECSRCRSEEL